MVEHTLSLSLYVWGNLNNITVFFHFNDLALQNCNLMKNQNCGFYFLYCKVDLYVSIINHLMNPTFWNTLLEIAIILKTSIFFTKIICIYEALKSSFIVKYLFGSIKNPTRKKWTHIVFRCIPLPHLSRSITGSKKIFHDKLNIIPFWG